ncbi:MAG: DNA replication and repair protein RecF, partial [Synergistes sp.]|nr:DNA replication and repair protein RecF [Synergistes sp.]
MRWHTGINLLVGENGAGKTNILEGIHIISGWGPLAKGTKSSNIPNWESGSSDVWLTGESLSKDIIKTKLSNRVTIKLNEKPVTASEMRWNFPLLAFLSDDMAVIEGSSSNRRRLMNLLLAIIIPVYAKRIAEYARGIRQKAVYLKRGLPTAVVDSALMPLAAWIWNMRAEAVALIASSLTEIGGLLPGKIDLVLKRGGVACCGSVTGLSAEEDYAISVQKNRSEEEARKYPVTGPHRDDILIFSDGRPAADVFSRGLRRRIAIALILALSDGVRRKTGKTPVLILDEVMSELDANGRKLLFDALLERKAQVFAATAEPYSGK